MSYSFVFILLNRRGIGFSKTETFMLYQTSDIVGSSAIFSTIFMSSGRTEPNTVYGVRHSSWLAKLIKNSGPEPTQATEPLLMVAHSSLGILLNMIPWALRVPWITPNGGPYGAYKAHTTPCFNQSFLGNIPIFLLRLTLISLMNPSKDGK